MLFADFTQIPEGMGIEKVAPFDSRFITHAFHDIDGTHSLIREWVPVMTLCTGCISAEGCSESSSVEELVRQISLHSPEEYPEAHRFAVESAGLSALTQMEWALRNALVAGRLSIPGTTKEKCSECIRRIWAGQEEFADVDESPDFRQRMVTMAERLFRAYEILLLKMGRDRNLAAARCNPAAWRVPGSMEFLAYLKSCGVKNYFVTGAVVEYDGEGHPHGTMVEEVLALGYEIGPGCLIEKLEGSTWREKLPKNRIMFNLCKKDGIQPRKVLVTGDGRSEIDAGAAMGALCISRLPETASRQREIHRALKTNLILERYELPTLSRFLFDKQA